MMVRGVVKEEKLEQVKALNNKEVWKIKTETLAKIVMNQDNLDNQDKPYDLEQIFTNDTAVAEDVVEGQEENQEFFADQPVKNDQCIPGQNRSLKRRNKTNKSMLP